MLSTHSGMTVPSLARIAEYHPQWALAAAMGSPVRPDVRVLSVNFPSAASIGQRFPSSFAEPVTKYAIFGGCELTVDPTAAFTGNILKGLNDVTMALVSAVTFTLETTDARGNYTPVFDDVPLQLIPKSLTPYVGMWALIGPAANVKAAFVLQSLPNGGVPFTAWLTMSYMVLEGNCADYFRRDLTEVRKELRAMGICCGGG